MERFETKYDLLDRAYADIRLKRTTKALMQYLVAKSDQKGCHPGVDTIAAAIRMSERTVQRHMRLLEQYGYIRTKSRYYRQEQLTNQYEFVLDVIDVSSGVLAGQTHPGGNRPAHLGQRGVCDFNKISYIQKIMKTTSLTNKDRLVLIYLVHKAGRDGVAYGDIPAICRELHMSRRLLQQVVLALHASGYLLLNARRGRLTVKLLPPEGAGRRSDVRSEHRRKATDSRHRLHQEPEGVVRHERHEGGACRQKKKQKLAKLRAFIFGKLRRILTHFLS